MAYTFDFSSWILYWLQSSRYVLDNQTEGGDRGKRPDQEKLNANFLFYVCFCNGKEYFFFGKIVTHQFYTLAKKFQFSKKN